MALQKVKNIVKLSLDEFSFEEFRLIAIQTSLEDYKLAFTLNKTLSMYLTKKQTDIILTQDSGSAYFSHYTFDDVKNDLTWNLVQNKAYGKNDSDQENSLFKEIDHKFLTQFNLIPELHMFDYLIKIDEIDSYFDIDSLLISLNNLKHISTVYLVDLEQIKSTNNLIF